MEGPPSSPFPSAGSLFFANADFNQRSDDSNDRVWPKAAIQARGLSLALALFLSRPFEPVHVIWVSCATMQS